MHGRCTGKVCSATVAAQPGLMSSPLGVRERVMAWCAPGLDRKEVSHGPCAGAHNFRALFMMHVTNRRGPLLLGSNRPFLGGGSRQCNKLVLVYCPLVRTVVQVLASPPPVVVDVCTASFRCIRILAAGLNQRCIHVTSSTRCERSQ